MILIATKNQKLGKQLRKELTASSFPCRILDVGQVDLFKDFYATDVSAVVCDGEFDNLPDGLSIDVLNSLGRRIPVIVMKQDEGVPEVANNKVEEGHISEHVTVIPAHRVDDIVNTLKICVAGHVKKDVKAQLRSIPFYNPLIPIRMLRDNGALAILTIDASEFSKVAVEYGFDVYMRVKEAFANMLFDLWGTPGSFRESDVIFRKSMHSNTYVIFLSRSRDRGVLPLPGALERAADRVSFVIQNAMWKELFTPGPKRMIPDCVRALPHFGIGTFGVINNPCMDIHEILERGLDSSRDAAVAQINRLYQKQRELMQTLIHSEEFLTPHFQAIFHLKGITQEDTEEFKRTRSISHLTPHLYGFESLIRVNQQQVVEELKGVDGIDPKFLRPDVIFSMAKETKVALELDQACLKLAAKFSSALPGNLMVNILPRNLYHIERLNQSFQGRKGIMFEVSESEAINNLDLVMKAKDVLEKGAMKIVADDFGRGYSSLERVIKLQPHVIKFDRSMVQDIHKDPIKQVYVKGLVRAGKILKTLVLAEGVELWEEAVVLQEMGIDLIQGFLLHQPQSVEKILEQVQEPSSLKQAG